MSRNIDRLHPQARKLYRKFDRRMKKQGIPYVVTSVDRTILEQMALYVQGRLPVRDVNRFRAAAGMLPVAERDNKVVTWTLRSLHVTNHFDGQPENDFSRAFDIVIVRAGRAVWDLKADVNLNELPDYEEAGAIWEELGGTWGGRWKSRDACHFQI